MEPVESRAGAQSENPPNLNQPSGNSDAGVESSKGSSPVKTARENGSRVSLNGEGDIGGSELDGGGSGSGVPVGAVGDRSDAIVGGDGVVLEDSELNGASSLLKMQESKNLRGLDTVIDVLQENEKREFDSSNGVNLVADACKDVSFSDAEVKGDNGHSLQGEPVDGDAKHSDGNEMEDEGSDEKHDFDVGDFVWGKIKSHPWWPGRIYDPSDASDYALKVKQGDKILVAYFGDGTFAWCNPSQLKPLDDNFVDMSSQSSSKNFVNAVESAMEEIGRLVDLKMTCSCVPKDNLTGFGRTLVVNAGIKEGLLIPEGGIDKFSSALFEPAELLTGLKNAAQNATATSLLGFTVLKSWLSSFYRAKGVLHLPSYYGPDPVPGLEDKSRDWTDDVCFINNGAEFRYQGPQEEDWISSPRGRKNSQITQSSLQKCQGSGHYQKRKQKSLAEILEAEMDVQEAENRTQVSGGDRNSGQPTSSAKRNKRKSTVEDAAEEGETEANDGTEGEKLQKLKSLPGGKKGRSIKNDGEGKDKTEDAVEAVADLGKPRPLSGRKKRKDSAEADEENKGGADVVSKSDGGGVKNSSNRSSSRKKRNSNLEGDNGGEENETVKKSAEKVDGINSSARGRRRNPKLKVDIGGGQNEEKEKLDSAVKGGGSNSSTRGRKKRNLNVKDDNGGDKSVELKENSNSAEKVDRSNSLFRSRKKRNSNVKDDNGGGKSEDMKNSNSAEKLDGNKTPSRGRKKRNSNVTDDDDAKKNEEKTNEASGSTKKTDGITSSRGITKELLREESFSRERKKSKYLSPPYTNIHKAHGKKEMEAQYLKMSSEAHLGEKSTNESPRIELSGDRSQNQLFKETGGGDKPEESGFQARTIDPSLVKAPANEVLSKMRSAALNPQYFKGTDSVDTVEQFFSAFRSSSYRGDTNGEYSEKPRGRKRKLEKSEPESSVKEPKETKKNNSSSDHKPQRKKARKSEEAKPNEQKEKQDATVPTQETKKKGKDKESNGEATGATLLVTFGPGSSLPSKKDLIEIYGKFGALNKKETEMFYANYCAKVVFQKRSEAEEAFNVSQLSSPFGAASVTFRLQYKSEAKTRQLQDISSHKASASTRKGRKAPELQSDPQTSDSLSGLNFMKEKLEEISALVGTSDGQISADMKSTLEGEIKVLLEKVSTMVKSS